MKKQRLASAFFFVSTILLSICFGYLLGRMVTNTLAFPSTPIVLQQDNRPSIPVITIEGIRNGKVEGTIIGEARLFLGSDLIIPDASGTFIAPADLFTKNEVTVLIPEEMRFVASLRGKYYYPVSSSAGEQLSPKYRVYFRTEEEAGEAGFRKGK